MMATKLLLTPAEFGEKVGVRPSGVRELVRAGQVRAVVQRVRRRDPGRKDKPRMFIPAAEVERYVATLPTWKAEGARRERPRRTAAGVRAEVEAATQYE